jgi:hypothetical protein
LKVLFSVILATLAICTEAHILFSTPRSRGAKIQTSLQKQFPCGGQAVTPLEERSIFPLKGGHVLFWHEYVKAPAFVYAFPTDEIASVSNNTMPGVYSTAALVASGTDFPYGDNRMTIRDMVSEAAQNGFSNTEWMKPGAAVTLQMAMPMTNPNRTYYLCSDVILGDSTPDLVQKCVANPTLAECALAYYPDDEAEAQFEDLCVKAPYLTSCNFHEVCEEGTTVEHEGSELGRYCGYQFLLKAACTVDVPSLPSAITGNVTECADRSKLCASGSVVKQCLNNPPVPAGYIPTSELRKQSQAFCAAAPTTKDCSSCKSDVSNTLNGYIVPNSPIQRATCMNMLSTFSDNCMHTPGNAACAAHKSMCVARPDDNISPDLSKTEFCVDIAHSDHSDMPKPSPSSATRVVAIAFVLAILL